MLLSVIDTLRIQWHCQQAIDARHAHSVRLVAATSSMWLAYNHRRFIVPSDRHS